MYVANIIYQYVRLLERDNLSTLVSLFSLLFDEEREKRELAGLLRRAAG